MQGGSMHRRDDVSGTTVFRVVDWARGEHRVSFRPTPLIRLRHAATASKRRGVITSDCYCTPLHPGAALPQTSRQNRRLLRAYVAPHLSAGAAKSPLVRWHADGAQAIGWSSVSCRLGQRVAGRQTPMSRTSAELAAKCRLRSCAVALAHLEWSDHRGHD